jgi:hypothetical protein
VRRIVGSLSGLVGVSLNDFDGHMNGGRAPCTLRPKVVRTCSDCGLTKLIADYTPIKGTPYRHRRCKPCRARRAWETNHPGRSYDEWLDQSCAPDVMLSERTCRECGVTRPLVQYTPIKAC